MVEGEPRVVATTISSTETDRDVPASHVEATGPARYQITGEVARGGTGVILRATDAYLGRDVAIKRALRLDPLTLYRFRREIQITARLQHPGIIPLYDAGEWTDSEPYFSMKLVEAGSLRDSLAATSTLEDRLALVPRLVAVAEAVAYAHSRGVVHRDLKPSNVLVGAFEETVVIDWGLAKHVSETDPAAPAVASAVDAQLTIMGEVAGTPAYMPPEQAEGLDQCGMPGDVYALGAMLYHLLAGAAPFVGEATTVIEALRRGAPTPVDEREPGAPADLVAIVIRAMARDPAERYPSAERFADDLRRFMTGRLVVARRYSWLDLVRRFVRRYRWRLVLAAVVAGAAATQGVIAFRRVVAARTTAETQGARATREAAAAVEARHAAQREADARFFAEVEATVEQDPTRAVAIIKGYPKDGPSPTRAAGIAMEALERGAATRVFTPRNGAIRLAYAADGATLVLGERFRAEIYRTDDGSHHVLSPELTTYPSAIAILPGGHLVWCDSTGVVEVWDSFDAPGHKALERSAPCTGMAVRSDGHVMMRFGDGLFGWEPTTNHLQRLGGVGAWVLAPSGDRAALLGATAVKIVDDRGGEIASVPARDAQTAEFSADGKRLVVAAAGGLVAWQAKRIERYPEIEEADVRAIAAPSGSDRVIAVIGDQLTLLEPGRPPRRRTLGQGSARIQLSPSGETALIYDNAGSIVLASLATLELAPLRGTRGMISEAQWSPDGRSIASTGRDRRVRIWEAHVPDARVANVADVVVKIEWLRAGLMLIHGRHGSYTWRTDEATPRPLGGEAVLSHDLQRIAVAQATGVDMIAVGDDRRTEHLAGGPAAALAFTVGGRLVIGDNEGTVRVFDSASGSPREIARRSSPIIDLQTAGRGEHVAIAWQDGSVRLVDAATGAARDVATGRALHQIAVAPDGSGVVMSAAEHVLLWQPEGAGLRELAGPTLEMMFVAWAGDHPLASSRDGSLWSWDSRTGTGHAIARHATPAEDFVVFGSPPQLLVNTIDGTVRISGLDGEDEHVLLADPDEIYAIARSPDGTLLATGNGFGRVVVRRLPPTPDWTTTDWRAWLEARSSVTVDDLPVGR
jgi:eukaryotic-like serine/threonine-protein kinase